MMLCGVAVAISITASCSQSTQPNANSTSANMTTANTEPRPTNSVKPVEIAVKSGKDLYTINCMTCHKDSGKGGKVTVEGKTINPDDLTSANMIAKTDDKLYSYIADGIVDEGMPAFKDKLSPEEIKSVVAHVRTLQQGKQ